MDSDSQEAAKAIVRVSRLFYDKGWSLATSSNYSIRTGDHVLITASGKDKGTLNESDVVLIDLHGKHISGEGKSSAESLLHCELYKFLSEIRCVIHIHSTNSTFLSMHFAAQESFSLQGYEMLKALSGVETHEHAELIPILPNSQNIPRLAHWVAETLRLRPKIHCFLIEGHGLYTWGRNVHEAQRHTEALEFLFGCEVQRLMAGNGEVRK